MDILLFAKRLPGCFQKFHIYSRVTIANAGLSCRRLIIIQKCLTESEWGLSGKIQRTYRPTLNNINPGPICSFASSSSLSQSHFPFARPQRHTTTPTKMSSPPAIDFPSDDIEMADESASGVEQSMSNAPPAESLFLPGTPQATPMRTPAGSAVARRALGMSTPKRTPLFNGESRSVI